MVPFRERGYPNNILERAFIKAQERRRGECQSPENNGVLKAICNSVEKHWNIITADNYLGSKNHQWAIEVALTYVICLLNIFWN